MEQLFHSAKTNGMLGEGDLMARAGGRQRAALGERSEEENELFVQALARGLTILALFDVEHPEWSLNDICLRTGISKTTAYRMLRTLEWKGFVVFDIDTERYHLGPAMIPGAYLSLSYVSFVRSTHPFLEDLAKATGETVELTVESAQGAVVVDQVATSHPFKPNLPTGRILRSMANSAVRMWVALKPEEERGRLLREPQLQFTPHSTTDPGELAAMLEQAAVDGVAYDMEEQDLGVCAVSAPVFGPGGDVLAVLTVVAPSDRFGAEGRARNAEAVKKKAAEMAAYFRSSSLAEARRP
jgi:DNA-binding IclR family transcriptional regulator